MMVTASMNRLILVLPVPVTAFRHMVDTDMIKMEKVTTLKTGTAADM